MRSAFLNVRRLGEGVHAIRRPISIPLITLYAQKSDLRFTVSYVGSNSTHSLAHSLTNQTNHIYISNPDQKPKPLCLSTPRRNMHTYTFIQAEYLALSCLLLFLFLFLFFFVSFLDEMNFYGSPQNSVRNFGRTSGRAACPFLSSLKAVPDQRANGHR